MNDATNDGIKKTPPKTIVLPNGNGILYILDDGEEDTTIRPAQVIPRIQADPAADVREELHEFQTAMKAIERDNGHRFLDWRHVLEAIHALGYRKVARPTFQPDPPPAANS